MFILVLCPPNSSVFIVGNNKLDFVPIIEIQFTAYSRRPFTSGGSIRRNTRFAVTLTTAGVSRAFDGSAARRSTFTHKRM